MDPETRPAAPLLPSPREALPKKISTKTWRILRILAVNVLVLGFGVLLIELLFGGWFASGQLNLLNIPRNVSVSYNLDGLYDSEDRTAEYVRDRYGFRGTYPSPDSIDILTIGGSTTDQRFVTEGKTWQDVLAQEFKKAGKTVYVVNAGVDGQSTLGHIKSLEWWLPHVPGLKAKYFLYYIGINELYSAELSAFDALLLDGYTPTFLDLYRDRSALYYLYRTARGTYEAYEARLAHQPFDLGAAPLTEKPLLADHAGFMQKQLQAYERRLRRLLQRTKEMGATPICVTQVYRLYKESNGRILGLDTRKDYRGVQINGVDFYMMMQLLNRTTISVCRDEGGIPVDLAGELDFEDVDFYDSGHNTPQGSAKIGRYLYDRLQALF